MVRGGGAFSRSFLWALPLLLLFACPVVRAQNAAYTLSCSGVVVTDSNGAPDCTDGASPPSPVAWTVVPPFDVSQLDFGEAGQAFAAGFVMVGMCALLGMAVGAILDMVRGRRTPR